MNDGGQILGMFNVDTIKQEDLVKIILDKYKGEDVIIGSLFVSSEIWKKKLQPWAKIKSKDEEEKHVQKISFSLILIEEFAKINSKLADEFRFSLLQYDILPSFAIVDHKTKVGILLFTKKPKIEKVEF